MTKSTKKAGLVVKSSVKSGSGGLNHSRSVLSAKKSALVVKSSVKSGSGGLNHSRLFLSA